MVVSIDTKPEREVLARPMLVGRNIILGSAQSARVSIPALTNQSPHEPFDVISPDTM